MKILVTGANGFLGSHIIEKAVQKDLETVAAIRPKANTEFLEGIEGFTLLYVNYESLESHLKDLGKFDLIIHNAGLIKSFFLQGYLNVNVDLTKKILNAIKQTDALSKGGKFVYISSMAAKGPVGNNGPISNYGRSKLKAEEIVKHSGLDYLIFRPTGIYGKRDLQFLPLIKTLNLGFYPLMTSRKHQMTLINVRDVAENILNISRHHKNETVHLDDGHIYHHSDLKNTFEKLLGKRSIPLILPRPLVLFFLFFSDLIERALKRMPKVSIEQYREISGDWNYDFSQERRNIPLNINYSLIDGFKEAISYYRDKNLI